MRFEVFAVLAAACSVSAQSVVGKSYGMAAGVTGGSGTAVTPTTADELAKALSDDTPRIILINKEWDFTGTTAKQAGCDRKSCSQKNGGQFYLGDISCGGSDNVAVSSITYDTAGTTPLVVGSNKSILGIGGKGAFKGKGLQLKAGAKNVIIQGIKISNLNPGIVWGGDAIDFKGDNTAWVDHCEISLVGRQMLVSHYTASKITVSNNIFNGKTTTSATCNGNHYWAMMFIANGDMVTLDKNQFNDISGRSPKLGADGVTGTFQATNNYFLNSKGHAFDAYNGASALIEGNVFKNVAQPITSAGAKVSTVYTVKSGGAACSSALGRACVANSVDSSSGALGAGESTGTLSTLGKIKGNLVAPMDVTKVEAYVLANAGPSKLGAASAAGSTAVKAETEPVAAAAPAPAPAPATNTNTNSGTAQIWQQCGGQGYTGPTKCASGLTCTVANAWYSQCLSAKVRRQEPFELPGFDFNTTTPALNATAPALNETAPVSDPASGNSTSPQGGRGRGKGRGKGRPGFQLTELTRPTGLPGRGKGRGRGGRGGARPSTFTTRTVRPTGSPL